MWIVRFTIFFKTVLKFIRNFQCFPRKLYCSVYDCSFISRKKRRKCPLYFKSNSQFRGVVNIFEKKKKFVEILLPLVIVLLQILFENSMSLSDGQRILWTAVGKFCNLLMLLNLYFYITFGTLFIWTIKIINYGLLISSLSAMFS